MLKNELIPEFGHAEAPAPDLQKKMSGPPEGGPDGRT
jgi:hypothetical protein